MTDFVRDHQGLNRVLGMVTGETGQNSQADYEAAALLRLADVLGMDIRAGHNGQLVIYTGLIEDEAGNWKPMPVEYDLPEELAGLSAE